MTCVHCGHSMPDHNRRGGRPCLRAIPTGRFDEYGFAIDTYCGCPGWESAVLPAPGERLEFGKHRQRSDDAETAPAWPEVGTLRRSLDRQADKAADRARTRRR